MGCHFRTLRSHASLKLTICSFTLLVSILTDLKRCGNTHWTKPWQVQTRFGPFAQRSMRDQDG